MIAVVGSGVAGLSVAEALREQGFDRPLRVFGAEACDPYERPTLSKRFLVERTLGDPPLLRPAGLVTEAGIAVESGVEVVSIDAERQAIRTAAGEEIGYEVLVLAMGAQPRRLELPGAELKGVHYLRELADARRLRTALHPGGRVAIVGGGVVGLEVAASATDIGAATTVIEAAPQLMGRVVPAEFSTVLEELHRARGVIIKTDTRPVAFRGSAGAVRGVVLEDGEVVRAETIVIGVGVAPRSELAAQAGLAVDDGVIVDEYFRTSDENIFAVGDVARVFHAMQRRHMRIEQWQPAQEQGRHAAAAIMGAGVPYRDTPWMWSDQHDLHIQATGFGFDGAELIRRGDLAEREGLAYLAVRDERLVAACGVSLGTGVARSVRAAGLLIERAATIGADVLRDPALDLRRYARELAEAT